MTTTAHFVSYLADPTDPTFSLWDVDLNGYERGTSMFETDPDTFDLGAPDLEGVWLSDAGTDDDVLSAYRRGRVEASFDLRIGPGPRTLDSMTAQLRRLNAALNRTGVWVVQQPGAAAPVLIDYYPSPLTQQLMPGERTLFFLWQQLQQPRGMTVRILRRPKMRGPALAADLNLAHNGTFAEDHDGDGVPSFWSWSSMAGLSAVGYDWSFGAHTIQIASTAAHFLSQSSDPGAIVPGQTYTAALDVAGNFGTLPAVRVRIDWLDGTSTLIGSSVYSAPVAFLLAPQVAFARPAVSALAPAGAVTARWGLEVTPASSTPGTLWVRDAQLEEGAAPSTFRAGFETISQVPGAPFYKRYWAVSRGNADAIANIRATPAVGHLATRMVYARRSGSRDSAMAMEAPVTGWAAANSTALLNGTTTTTDAGRSVALTSLANDVMRSVIREASLTTDESALRGTWRLRAALRGALGDVYQITGAYGVGDVADLPYATLPAPRRLDLTAPPASSAYYVLDLGLVRVPALAPGLYLELRAMRETTPDSTGVGNLYIDQVWLEPADDAYASAEVPGARLPGPVVDRVLGKDLATPPDTLAADPGTSNAFVAGSVYNNDLLLNDSWEACSLKVGATTGLTPGVEHTYTADVIMYTASEKVARTHGELRVHNLTDNVQVVRVVLKNDPGVPWFAKSFVLRFTPVAGKVYQVYVVQTVAQAVGNVRVRRIRHSFVPPLGSVDTIAVDGDQRLAYVLDSFGQIKAPLTLTPPFLVLEPGVQLIRVSFSGLGPNGSDVALDGEVAQAHDATLTAKFGIHHIPRWFN